MKFYQTSILETFRSINWVINERWKSIPINFSTHRKLNFNFKNVLLRFTYYSSKLSTKTTFAQNLSSIFIFFNFYFILKSILIPYTKFLKAHSTIDASPLNNFQSSKKIFFPGMSDVSKLFHYLLESCNQNCENDTWSFFDE